MYTPQKTRAYEEFVQMCYLTSRGPYYGESPLLMNIVAYFEIPKSVSESIREKMISKQIIATKKPDWDNIGKAVSDALNGIAYKDDKQVMGGGLKFYGLSPRVEVKIQEVSHAI